MFVYIRFDGEYFESRTYYSILKIIQIAIEDIKSKKALPCSIIDEHGNAIYNKKEIIKAVEEYCLRNHIDGEFYTYLWNKN